MGFAVGEGLSTIRPESLLVGNSNGGQRSVEALGGFPRRNYS